ncbi:MAG: hypothetical protein QOG85_779 [Gaiellaceae bacterium]|nr:hypothetical protein [Gaiellaceae bacterium]
MHAVRALIVIAGFLALAGIATAAIASPTTIVRSPTPVAAVTQDGNLLAWISINRTKCNVVHITGDGNSYVLPQPPNDGMTCHWNIATGVPRLAVAAGALAALWTLHEHNSNWVVTAQVGGKEIPVERLAHQSDGTRWWLGGTAGGGSTLAYSSVDVEYVDPLACGSGGSCAKKIADGEIDLVSDGQKTRLPNSGPALGLAVSTGRIAYVPATTVSQAGAPVSSATAAVEVDDISDGSVVSQVNPAGVPVAVGLSAHVVAVLARASGKKRLTWYDVATGVKLGGIGVPSTTAPVLTMDDQVIVYRVGQYLHALTISTGHGHVVATTAVGAVGLSLEQGRLVWAESSQSSGRIRAVSLP